LLTTTPIFVDLNRSSVATTPFLRSFKIFNMFLEAPRLSLPSATPSTSLQPL
jgi:hypothetical protein